MDAAIAICILWGLSLVYQIAYSTPYLVLTVITVLVVLPTFDSAKLYTFRSTYPTVSYSRIFIAWTGVFTLLLLIGYITQTSILFSRALLLSWFLVTPLALCMHHFNLRLLLKQLQIGAFNVRKAVIAGTGVLSQRLAQQLRHSPQLDLQFCGFFTEQPLDIKTEFIAKPLIGTLEDLPDYVRRYRIDVVYIALTSPESQRVSQLIEALQDTTVCVYFVPSLTAFNLLQAKVSEVGGVPLITVSDIPSLTPQAVIKRLREILISATTLLASAPLMLILAIVLMLTVMVQAAATLVKR